MSLRPESYTAAGVPLLLKGINDREGELVSLKFVSEPLLILYIDHSLILIKFIGIKVEEVIQ